MIQQTRRQWLRDAAIGLLAPLVSGSRLRSQETAQPRRGCSLSIGTYSMRGIALERALGIIADIGYDGIEIAVAPGFDGEPARMSAERRREVRRLLADRRLRLTALMENLPPATEDARHRADLDRLRGVMALAHDLEPDRPPLVQTVLGGGTWEEKRELFRDRLGSWLSVARDAGVVIA